MLARTYKWKQRFPDCLCGDCAQHLKARLCFFCLTHHHPRPELTGKTGDDAWGQTEPSLSCQGCLGSAALTGLEKNYRQISQSWILNHSNEPELQGRAPEMHGRCWRGGREGGTVTAPQKCCPHSTRDRVVQEKENSSTLSFCVPEQTRSWSRKSVRPGGTGKGHASAPRPTALRTHRVVPVHAGVGNFIPNVLV